MPEAEDEFRGGFGRGRRRREREAESSTEGGILKLRLSRPNYSGSRTSYYSPAAIVEGGIEGKTRGPKSGGGVGEFKVGASGCAQSWLPKRGPSNALARTMVARNS